MRTIADLIGDAPVLAGLAPHHLELIAGCGENAHFPAGEPLFRTGEPADRFFLIRGGSVALELAVPQHDPLTISTLHDGEIVGWSWLFEPHRWAFDARAVEDTGVDRLRRRLPARQVRGRPRARLPADAALRGRARRPPPGHPAPTARRLWRRPRRLSPAATWCPWGSGSLSRRQETADTWTLELEGTAPLEFEPGQFTMLGAAGCGEVPISISGDPDEPGAARAHGARRRRGHGRRSAPPSRDGWWVCADPSADRGPWTRSRAQTWWSWREGSGSRR